MPSRDEALTQTWEVIEPGLALILGTDDDQGVTAIMYMRVYTAVYDYCVLKLRLQGPNVNVDTFLGGSRVYDQLTLYLTAYIKLLEPREGELFLSFYVRRWVRFLVGSGYLNNIFDYMNRFWAQKERTDGRRDVYEVATLCALKWRDHLFLPHAQELIAQVMSGIERQRHHEIVNGLELATAIKSLVVLGIDTNDLKKPNLVLYADWFESAFIRHTAEFYANESTEFLGSHNVVDYLSKCEVRLVEETQRAALYLHEHTKRPLTECLDKALILDHAEEMYTEFDRLLEESEITSMAKMYRLLNRVPSALDPLAERFKNYVKDEGLKAVAALEVPPLPKLYVHTIVAVYQRFVSMLSAAFAHDSKFDKALDDACHDFINRNSVSGTRPRVTSRTPELLAKYCDTFLKRLLNADAADMSVDHVMTVFKFVADKDAFEIHYRRLLAKRLIHNTLASAEAEEVVIQRLQDENLSEYTSKMLKMFQDIQQSEDLKQMFVESVERDGPEVARQMVSDFTPLVLAETMWPFPHKKEEFTLPPLLKPTYDRLEELYNKKHQGRLLKWLWHLGRVELRANLARAGRPPFIFTMSLFQMAILMPYNDKNVYAFGELLTVTGLTREQLEGYLAVFVKLRLLVQEPAGPVAEATTFTLVSEYRSKKPKVSFTVTLKSDVKGEAEEALREIDEDRKMYLQACIVRVMKARKTSRHAALINEVIQQSHLRFHAAISDIKKAIDLLIEKEYLRRVSLDEYEYLA